MVNFNYTGTSIKIKSNWFDDMKRKQNTYQKITYKGLNLYFQLYKFRLYNQENEHTFVTSISLLRKETGYSTEEVFDLLKKLKGAKVIKLENVSRWDYLIDKRIERVIYEDGTFEYVEKVNIKDKDILVITASDLPKTNRKPQTDKNGNIVKDKDGNVKEIDSPVSDDDYYLAIPFKMLDYYKSKGLNEKYYSLYCLILKWSFGHMDGKMNMKIENIAKILDFDKDTIHRMIYQMNRKYLLSSVRKVRKAGGYKFEHYLLRSCDEEYVEWYLRTHKENMDKITKRADKRKNNKKEMNIEEDMETIEDDQSAESNVKEGFNTKKPMGEPDPFEDLSLLDDLE